MIGIDKPKDIGLDFSFVTDTRMDEDNFFALLEQLEEEMQLELINCAWRFESVKQLVEYIDRHR